MIAVERVTKRFGEIVAVDDISFEVPSGEVVGFLGPNGAGKTTTMRMLTGTLQPDQGQVLFDGQSIGEDLTGAKERVGYLPESNPLYEEMLVAEYLEFAARMRDLEGPQTRSAVHAAVEETGLEGVFFRPVGELSKGFRQRVGLAAAILHQPEILVLDEPTEGLDPNQRVDIRALVSNLGKQRTVLLSTHVMQEVEATCSRILVISKGALVADGTVEDLIAGRQGISHYTVEVQGGDATETLAKLPGVDSHTASQVEGRTRVRLAVSGEKELRPEIFRIATEKDWVLWELHRERASLEQLFHELTADQPAPASSTDAAADAGEEVAP
jgi:ABC-2 type transport system ATP-binding protein